ncbi:MULTISPECIES: phage baseplate assembly protein [unclassified Bradyrhizobium]|uniref:phage baseplate assembly protein domain-containing protein n=1 Tax=unclassified Bradyrhizobium TaxID=2631580 RepID=UPI0028E29980|nr:MULTISPECIES: phage baseplate assembly protein [unclassified Bradyrhizobium]
MWLWFPEGQEGLIGTLRRATVQKTDDCGTQQILKNMTGLKSEAFEDVYRPQPHGFSSHAPKGSEGVFLALGGRSDRLLALGFEHKDFRPKNTPEGGTILYNHTGDVVRVFKDQLEVYHTKTIKLSIGKGLTQSDDGHCTVVMTADSVTVTRGQSSVQIEDAQITHISPHVVIKSPKVDLGDIGGTPVGLCGGGCATKVFAV